MKGLNCNMRHFRHGSLRVLGQCMLCCIIIASRLSVCEVSAQAVSAQSVTDRNVSAQAVSALDVPVQVSSWQNVSSENVPVQQDGRSGVSAKLEEYLKAIEILPIEEKISETDTLISACRDSSIRQVVAEIVFEHYRWSKLMGDEAVAVHVADKWGLGGEAASFADINRLSLIGMKAPSLAPVVPDFGGGIKTVLYFYDTDCSTCRKMTSELVSFIGSIAVDFVAFYVGSDKEAWSRYITENFPQDFPVRHYMDAERKSDFAVKYGVDGTPRLFLIDGNGVVQGRRLDVGALKILLQTLGGVEPVMHQDDIQSSAVSSSGVVSSGAVSSSGAVPSGAVSSSGAVPDGMQPTGRYGSEESVEFFDRLFSSFGNDIAASDINFVSDYIVENYSAASSVAERNESKQLLADMLYYLSSRHEEVYRESCHYLITKYILPDTANADCGLDIWTTEEDSLYVLSYASLLNDLLSRAQVGTTVPKIKLKGTLYRLDRSMEAKWSQGRNVNVRLDRMGGERNILVFYSPGCGDCSEQIAKINAIVSAAGLEKVDEDIRFFLVNVGEMEKNSPRTFRKAADSFDFSELPYLVETDSKGIVVRRYFKF